MVIMILLIMITIVIIFIIKIIIIIIIMIIIITRSTRRAQILSRRVHSESTNLCQGHESLPKFNGSILVSSSIFPENLIEIHL